MRFLDIETDMGAPVTRNIVTINLDGVVYERRKLGDDGLREIIKTLIGEVICAHYAKFDTKTIYQNFGILLDRIWCTQVAAKILRNGMKNKDGSSVSNALVDVLDYYLGVREEIHKDKKELRTKYSLKRDLTPRELEYIKADVAHLPALQAKLADAIERDKLGFVFRMEMALMPVLIKKEVKGIRVDLPLLNHLTSVWKRGKRIATMLLDREVMNLMYLSAKPTMFAAYSYSSTQQVTQLFKDLGLPVPIKTVQKGTYTEIKESNDEDTLNEYLYENPNSHLKRFIELYLWFKEIDKLISTYGEKMAAQVDANGYIHTEYNQLGAETGRLSSGGGVNLQNLPANGHGARVRNCFLPDPDELLVDTDMDGAEIRIAADYSGDPLLIDSIEKGVDMHSKLASGTYSILAGEEVTITKDKEPIMIKGIKLIPDKVRSKHKAVIFSYFYLCGPPRVYTILGADIRQFRQDIKQACKDVHTKLGEQLPVLMKFLKAKVTEANTRGFLRLPKSGRIRYFRKDAYGDAANNDIQGINAEAIKMAMILMDRWLTETGYGRLVLNVHDQLVTSCNPLHVEAVKAKQTQVMADSLSYFLTRLKGASSCKVTTRWEK